jgi:hypothetical protein
MRPSRWPCQPSAMANARLCEGGWPRCSSWAFRGHPYPAMRDEDGKLVRHWRVVAAELEKETDNAKVLALMVELERALEELEKHTKPGEN